MRVTSPYDAPMSGRALRIATLLFGSGMCALIYQIAWLRELRLVFGASTPASAAVLAVFMGGLGYGSWLLSGRADRVARPLTFYAKLEGGIAVSAALTPALMWVARAGYVAVGGTVTLGVAAGTVVRLLLSALVLLPPTILMGGTLPAAARAATTQADVSRRSAALLYGLNTLGAVTGAAVATFVMLEVFGTRTTLWLGCGINGLIAVLARELDRRLQREERAAGAASALEPSTEAPGAGEQDSAGEQDARSSSPIPRPFVLAAAAGVGLAFLLMELIWYRMLSPLLGGSSYTFGLILAVALLGIGLGGLAYTLVGRERPARLGAFAVSCGLEALFLSIPYALGDRIALLALSLRGLGVTGLGGYAVGWTLVTAVVVLPAAIVAGYQFPLLIALLGRARHQLGRDVGLAYAFNTVGAIGGSLIGGFLAMPLLGALGAWRATVWLLVALAMAAAALAWRQRPRWGQSVMAVVSALAAPVLLYLAMGPTAIWRHTPIGAGRADTILDNTSPNALKRELRERRRAMTWEADGRESTVGLYTLDDTSFLVNGKSDGAAVADGGTQVMGGLVGALLQPEPIKRALVIGLGTGSTTGWLASLPSIERVDVVELEPVILDVARICSAVNRDVLNNPKVHVIIGDAREVLLTTSERYDLVFSEPSNPYRAGIASLFTREFYRAVAERLTEGGVFVQWLQAYEIDAGSVRTVYATVQNVFPSVESWRTKYSDLVLLGRAADQPFDVERVRQRIAESPYREALMNTWRVRSVEGVLAHYVARPSWSRALAAALGEASVNIDDRNQLEFSIARALGTSADVSVEVLRERAVERGEAWPEMNGAEAIDWELVYDAGASMRIAEAAAPVAPLGVSDSPTMRRRLRAIGAWTNDQHDAVLREWNRQHLAPRTPVQIMVLADAYAVTGNAEQAEPLISELQQILPVEAEAIRARLLWALSKPREAWKALSRALVAYRDDPWANKQIMTAAFMIAPEVAKLEPDLSGEILEVLAVELPVHLLHYLRVDLRLRVALQAHDAATCTAAIAEMGPHFPWEREMLERRVACYQLDQHPDLGRAKDELDAFVRGEGIDLAEGIRPAEDKRKPPLRLAPGRAAASSAPATSAEPDGSSEAAPSAAPVAESKPAGSAAPVAESKPRASAAPSASAP